MKNFKHIVMLTALFLMATSCTEEVSDSLKNTDQNLSASNSQLAVGKKMKLTHTMDENLSFYMHSTQGKDYPCEIEATGLNFSSSTYAKTDSKDVVDCILEVEELDLFFEGASYQLSVDEYLCEYIQYVPFRFFQYPVGASEQKQYELECDASCSEAELKDIDCNAVTGTYQVYSGGAAYTGANFSNKSPAVCTFDHSQYDDDAPNCDAGYTTSIKYTIYGEDGFCTGGTGGADESTCTTGGGAWTKSKCLATTNNSLSTDSVWTDTECGGSAYNCISGPTLEHIPDVKYSAVLYENKDLKSFTKEWTIDSLLEQGFGSNRYAANYSRILSSSASKATYVGKLLNTDFVGSDIEVLTSLSSSAYTKEAVDYNGDTKTDFKYYASHPFLGVTEKSSITRYVTKPYYGFYCLDKARDIKAQIRLFIREWDRTFETDSPTLDAISDYSDTAASRLMDQDGIYDGEHEWNNYADWDDFFTSNANGNQIFSADDPTVLIYDPATNDTGPYLQNFPWGAL